MTTVTLPDLPAHSEHSDASPVVDRQGRWVFAIILTFTAIGSVLAVLSDGGYMDDDVTHYLIARTAWERPALLLDEWGRPGFTIPYALVARIGSVEAGFVASRLMSVLLLGGSAWLAYHVARGVGVRHAWAAGLLLPAMPLVYFTSYTTTTETIAAFYAIAATALLLHGQRWAGAAVLALLPLTRHELIIFLIPVGLYFLWRRDLIAAALLLWAEVVWNVLIWAMSLYPPSGKLPIQRFFSTADAGALGYGYPWHYILRWIDMSGMVIVALALVGAMTLWRSQVKQSQKHGVPEQSKNALLSSSGFRAAMVHLMLLTRTRKGRVTLVVIGGAIGMVVLQTWLYMVNTHLSGGYARFLIPAGPWMAICAAAGLTPAMAMWRSGMPGRGARALLILLGVTVFISLLPGTVPLVSQATLGALLLMTLLTLLRPRRWMIRATCGLAIVVIACEWQGLARPHWLTDDQRLLRQTLADLQTQYPSHYITGSSPWIQYFLDQPVNLPRWHDPFPWDVQNHPIQTLYVYDETHGKQWILDEMAQLPHRLLGERSHPDRDEPFLRIYERLE